MIRRKLARASLAALAVTTVLTVAPRPASAAITSTCDISQFPAIAATQSQLQFSCLFTNSANPLLNELSSNFTFHDFANAQYHQGAARRATVTAASASGGLTITAAAGNFTLFDRNRPVSGTGIAPRAFISSITPTVATLNIAHTAAVPIGTVVTIENTNARSVVNGVTVAGLTVTSATANFNSADVGRSITGTPIPDGKTIASVTNATTVVMSAGASATAATAQTITIGATQARTSTRTVLGATKTTTVITSTAAAFGPSDTGMPVSCAVAGCGLAANSRITAVAGNTATIAPAAVAGGAFNVVIGAPSPTAPTNGSAMMQLATSLDLSPTLVAGSGACGTNRPEGFSLQGVWQNPGSFVTTGVLGAQPAGQVIAQVLFATSVTRFAGYIVQVPAGTAGDPQTAAHYDIVFPFLPTALAKCPAPNAVNVATSFEVLAVTASQNNIPTGIGSPSTAQVRYLAPNFGAAISTVATLRSNAAAPANWSFTRTCAIAGLSPVAVTGFSCGNA